MLLSPETRLQFRQHLPNKLVPFWILQTLILPTSFAQWRQESQRTARISGHSSHEVQVLDPETELLQLTSQWCYSHAPLIAQQLDQHRLHPLLAGSKFDPKNHNHFNTRYLALSEMPLCTATTPIYQKLQKQTNWQPIESQHGQVTIRPSKERDQLFLSKFIQGQQLQPSKDTPSVSRFAVTNQSFYHSFAWHKPTDTILDFTFGQAFIPQSGVSNIQPATILRTSKEIAPDLVHFLPTNFNSTAQITEQESQLAMLLGTRENIQKLLGLEYQVLTNTQR